LKTFEKLQLWVDPVQRQGPEAMAVDEWLLETVECPVLRVYEWAGEWASVGYFGELRVARDLFPAVELVRRWTGGGMVDHRRDWTYSLAVPRGEKWAEARGAASYRQIHEAVAAVLRGEGIEAWLSGGMGETGAAACFENPVSHDVLGRGSVKLAGAGQRRSRQGLLHQGSVAGRCVGEASQCRAMALADKLAETWECFDRAPNYADLASRIAARYGRPEWLGRR
jgi:lipoyl(octanoyl) transferase